MLSTVNFSVKNNMSLFFAAKVGTECNRTAACSALML